MPYFLRVSFMEKEASKAKVISQVGLETWAQTVEATLQTVKSALIEKYVVQIEILYGDSEHSRMRSLRRVAVKTHAPASVRESIESQEPTVHQEPHRFLEPAGYRVREGRDRRSWCSENVLLCQTTVQNLQSSFWQFGLLGLFFRIIFQIGEFRIQLLDKSKKRNTDVLTKGPKLDDVDSAVTNFRAGNEELGLLQATSELGLAQSR